MQSVLLRRPRLLVERDAKGEIRLRSLVVPTWTTRAEPSPPAVGAATSGPSPAPAAPVIDIATFTLERASARFVDHGTTPPYAEELSDVQLTLTPLTTDPGRPTRFTGSGGIAGGTFKVAGTGRQEPSLDLKVELRDFIVPRANPYLDRFTGWIATRGSLNATADYTLRGPRITASHDVVVRNLDVKAVAEHDEVERRVGLPFGFLVSVLKDARGDIKLTLPVSGDLSTREFDFQEAVWGAVRSLALRLVALPFSRIGSLFVSEDSKVQAVAIAPLTFEPGTATMGAGMDAHLGHVAGFLRGAPAMTLALEPIITQADVDALTGPTEAPDAMHTLGERRLEVVRGAFARAGIDAKRLQGRASRRPLVEATGASRVEMTPRPGGA
jgi:outer membrane protein OmpA-like peptidoglycan-associated protein